MRHAPGAVMLFAAGFGTRMGALTADRPKPMIAVAGRPLIDHALDLTELPGLARRVVNLHWKAEILAAHLAPRPGIALSWERGQILDTGGGLRAALPLLGRGAVFTLNTDAVWTGPNALATLAAHWDPARMEALLLLAPLAAAVSHADRGDFDRGTDGRLTRGAGFVFLGAQIIAPASLDGIPGPAFSLNRAWDRMIRRGRLFGVLHPGGWCDVGTPEGIAAGERLLATVGHV